MEDGPTKMADPRPGDCRWRLLDAHQRTRATLATMALISSGHQQRPSASASAAAVAATTTTTTSTTTTRTTTTTTTRSQPDKLNVVRNESGHVLSLSRSLALSLSRSRSRLMAINERLPIHPRLTSAACFSELRAHTTRQPQRAFLSNISITLVRCDATLKRIPTTLLFFLPSFSLAPFLRFLRQPRA
jgi:hypothetical protein